MHLGIGIVTPVSGYSRLGRIVFWDTFLHLLSIRCHCQHLDICLKQFACAWSFWSSKFFGDIVKGFMHEHALNREWWIKPYKMWCLVNGETLNRRHQPLKTAHHRYYCERQNCVVNWCAREKKQNEKTDDNDDEKVGINLDNSYSEVFTIWVF